LLTGYSRQDSYRSLLVAPTGVRTGLIERIERETELARDGRDGHIQMKTNHLVDEQYHRQPPTGPPLAGVRVDLLVRTSARSRPACPRCRRTSPSVRSWAQFLEHSRNLLLRR
jgi:polyphosphate kinase